MMTPQTMLGYVKAEPFRPFHIQMASGRAFDVRHSEMIKILKNCVLVFNNVDAGIPDDWLTVSLMLAESLSEIEVSVN